MVHFVQTVFLLFNHMFFWDMLLFCVFLSTQSCTIRFCQHRSLRPGNRSQCHGRVPGVKSQIYFFFFCQPISNRIGDWLVYIYIYIYYIYMHIYVYGYHETTWCMTICNYQNRSVNQCIKYQIWPFGKQTWTTWDRPIDEFPIRMLFDIRVTVYQIVYHIGKHFTPNLVVYFMVLCNFKT